MHTAICSFENRADAEQAIESLVESGYDRHDIHLEHRHQDGSEYHRQDNDNWDGMEREIAMDRRVVRRLGAFFERLFGHDPGAGHVGAYSDAVERGLYVVVVDAHDEAGAARAQSMLHGMEARDLNSVHRPGQPPVRDLVGARQATRIEQSFGTARSDMPQATPGIEAERLERERAFAAGQEHSMAAREPRPTESRDDGSYAPGLRCADRDQDKPR